MRARGQAASRHRPASQPKPPSERTPTSHPLGNQAMQWLLAEGVAQAKLRVSQPNDSAEQEADRVAEDVMRMPVPNSACGGRCLRCQGGREIQRSPAATGAGATVADSFTDRLGSGQPLEASTRAFFEPRFGRDFSNVRVHTGLDAHRSAEEISALAYTTGPHIVFRAGQYKPKSESGRRLLAHELTHVIQQQSGRAVATVQRQLYPPIPIIVNRRCEYVRLDSGAATPNTGIEVSWVGDEINIRARIQVTGPGATQEVADAMKEDIERMWNRTFADGYGSTCDVNMVLGGDTDPSRAQIIVGTGGSVDQSSTSGSTMYFMFSGSPDDLVWSPAHEFGHLLGLEDRRSRPWWDYFFETQPETSESGYEQNIMGAIPEGDYSRRTELVVESRNIRDWLYEYALREECTDIRGSSAAPIA